MEVYTDDMLVKSLQVEDYLKYLDEAFKLLRKYKIKLNQQNASSGLN